jgi:hypothetical protein
VTYDFNTVATEQVTGVTFSIDIDQFDDGLFVKINDTVIVDFNEGSYLIRANGTELVNVGLNSKFDTGVRAGYWDAYAGEGNPELVIDVAAGTVELLVDLKAGGRENILDDIQAIIDANVMRNENQVTNPLPVLNFEDGVTITTGLNNGTGNALITSQVVTVTGTYAGADDIDGDGVANWVDIDTDDDGIWDKYEYLPNEPAGNAVFATDPAAQATALNNTGTTTMSLDAASLTTPLGVTLTATNVQGGFATFAPPANSGLSTEINGVDTLISSTAYLDVVANPFGSDIDRTINFNFGQSADDLAAAEGNGVTYTYIIGFAGLAGQGFEATQTNIITSSTTLEVVGFLDVFDPGLNSFVLLDGATADTVGTTGTVITTPLNQPNTDFTYFAIAGDVSTFDITWDGNDPHGFVVGLVEEGTRGSLNKFDSDGDGVADYRDTDSNGGAAGDDRSNASLSEVQIDALEAGTASNSDGYILLSDAGVTLDLTLVETEVSNLEYIDMEDGGNAQTVEIDPGSLLNVTGAPNVLIIVGDANDTVNATDFVNTQKDTSIEGQTFSIYEGRTVEDTLTTLLIDDDISVFLA